MEKKLEDKILDKVYLYETKKTVVNGLVKGLILLLICFAIFLFGSVLWDYLKEQQTFDLFEVFTEDVETALQYIGQVIFIFYEETPKLIVVIFTISICLFMFLVLTFVRNFERIKKKIASLVRYWIHH